jgi:PKD repeat protein
MSHERIRFAAHDAFPNGIVNTTGVIMAAGHAYEITVIPNGPKDSYCDIEDVFDPADYPIADFSVDVWSMTVTVDGTASYDPDGTIVSYAWDFGDGMAASVVSTTHTYAVQKTYDITLLVTDNDGMTGSKTVPVLIKDDPPVAKFILTSTGFIVNVDASGSTDDFGIVSYTWNWGDGTMGSGKTATHTYGGTSGVAAVPGANQLSVRQPIPPQNVQGYTLDSNGNPVGCDVVITNTRTGMSVTVTSESEYGWYEYDLNLMEGGWLDGDIIRVEATAPGFAGMSEAPVLAANPTLDLNVIVYPLSMEVTITLTVTDELGQASSTSLTVTLGG